MRFDVAERHNGDDIVLELYINFATREVFVSTSLFINLYFIVFIELFLIQAVVCRNL